VLAAASGLVVARALDEARGAAARFGHLRPVLVATRDLAPGTVLAAGAVERRNLPAAAVAPGAAGEEALGRRLSAAVRTGEVVHGARVAPAGRSAVAALLPAGARGVAVPAGSGSLPLEVGDVVDVLATTGEDVVPPTTTVSAGAVVLDVVDDAVTVAVPADEAARVAYAVATGVVTLTLAGS
jgi:Flp pilus assembly protein CpaB